MPAVPDRVPTPGETPFVAAQAIRGWVILVVRQLAISSTTIIGVLALTFLLKPSEFAVYGYVGSAMIIAAGIGDLGLGASLIKGELELRDLGAALGLQTATWGVVAALLTALVVTLGLYGVPVGVTALLACLFYFMCLQTLPTALLERRLAFAAVSRLEVGQRVAFVLLAVLFAAIAPSEWPIAVAGAIAGIGGYVASLFLSGWTWRPQFRRSRRVLSPFASHWWQGRLASQLNYAAYPLLGGLLFSLDDVGLIVWALAVTQLPALLSPLAARVLLPTLGRRPLKQQVAVYRSLFSALLTISLPLLAPLLAFSGPLTKYIFGHKWLAGVTVLRLECFTTLLGLLLTPGVPLFYLVLKPRTVKRVIIGWAAATWAVTPIVSAFASFRGPSIVQITAAAAALIVFDRLLDRQAGFSPIRDAASGVLALAIAVGVGLLLLPLANGIGSVVGLALLVAAVQLGVALLLGGTDDVRVLFGQLRGLPGRAAVS